MCHAACPLIVEVEDDRRVVAVRADRDDPLFEGYTCIKGRQLADQQHHPDRVCSSLRKTDTGFEPISSAEALDEIAATIADIVAEHGPRAVASYTGTGAFQNSTSVPVTAAWHAGFGSPSFYTSVTIDQPAHRAAGLRLGAWEAGWHNFTDADVSLAVGYNPLVSSYGPAGGLQGTNPFVALRRAKDRGLNLIVIDPRRTELARSADVHLQVQPGEDPTLLAGMIRHILANDLHDQGFCARHVDRLDELTAAVEPFTLDYVAARARVGAADVVQAAEVFAAGPRGAAGTGTGPNMAPHSMLTEHLTLTLNVLCGRVNQPGDTLESGGFLSPSDTVRGAGDRAQQPLARHAASSAWAGGSGRRDAHQQPRRRDPRTRRGPGARPHRVGRQPHRRLPGPGQDRSRLRRPRPAGRHRPPHDADGRDGRLPHRAAPRTGARRRAAHHGSAPPGSVHQLHTRSRGHRRRPADRVGGVRRHRCPQRHRDRAERRAGAPCRRTTGRGAGRRRHPRSRLRHRSPADARDPVEPGCHPRRPSGSGGRGRPERDRQVRGRSRRRGGRAERGAARIDRRRRLRCVGRRLPVQARQPTDEARGQLARA